MQILIADDQASLADLLAEQVRPWGYEATVVHDGLAALDVLRASNAPPLALLDWLMPGVDGIEVCRQLREEADRHYSYLILVTGQGTRQDMIDGLEAGADDFLVKPVDPAELKARLAAGRRIITLQEQLRELALRDALTGLLNRAAILTTLEQELARSRRGGTPLGVVLADVDFFKRVNDSHGHLAGDAVLRAAAGRMRETLRPYDAVGRFGGEEFLLVLPGCGSTAAAALAERLRCHVAAAPVETMGASIPVTLSLGVCAWEGNGPPDSIALLRAADAALYRAKDSGRNRVALANDTRPRLHQLA
jgi:diguanylate cyclase (GGDEF)-like protein